MATSDSHFFSCHSHNECKFDAFSKIDGGEAGRADDDRKMTLEEWMSAYKTVKGYNFVCLDGVENDERAKEMFVKVDENGGGVVLLIEFCDYIKATEIAAGTETGALLAADEKPPPPGAEGAVEPEPEPNGGIGPTRDFLDFKECFDPYTVKGEEGKKLRKKGFRAADPNGNGLCSLAELEGFVLTVLVTKYPKDKDKKDARGDSLERGRDLWDAFRPSYIR